MFYFLFVFFFNVFLLKATEQHFININPVHFQDINRETERCLRCINIFKENPNRKETAWQDLSDMLLKNIPYIVKKESKETYVYAYLILKKLKSVNFSFYSSFEDDLRKELANKGKLNRYVPIFEALELQHNFIRINLKKRKARKKNRSTVIYQEVVKTQEIVKKGRDESLQEICKKNNPFAQKSSSQEEALGIVELSDEEEDDKFDVISIQSGIEEELEKEDEQALWDSVYIFKQFNPTLEVPAKIEKIEEINEDDEFDLLGNIVQNDQSEEESKTQKEKGQKSFLQKITKQLW